MTEYTTLKLKQIKAQYDELVRNDTFNQAPFNLLSDSERVLFVTELVESQKQYDRDQVMIEQHKKILSEIDNVYYKID